MFFQQLFRKLTKLNQTSINTLNLEKFFLITSCSSIQYPLDSILQQNLNKPFHRNIVLTPVVTTLEK